MKELVINAQMKKNTQKHLKKIEVYTAIYS